MIQVNIHQAKTNLSQLLQKVTQGEDVIIARAGKPIARLSGVIDKTRRRRLGEDHGLFEVPDDFNSPLSSELIDEFES